MDYFGCRRDYVGGVLRCAFCLTDLENFKEGDNIIKKHYIASFKLCSLFNFPFINGNIPISELKFYKAMSPYTKQKVIYVKSFFDETFDEFKKKQDGRSLKLKENENIVLFI